MILKLIHKNIIKAKTIPSSLYYCNDEIAKLKETVFARSWQFVCDTRNISKSGDVFPYDFIQDYMPEPLLLVNDKNKLKTMTNVCTHRGNILVEKACNLQNGIVCKYHGRRFDMCGKMKFMPKCDELENFPSKEDNLIQINTATWKQFVFASIQPNIDFKELIKNMDDRIGWMPINQFVFSESHSKEYIVNANWALYCDNYLEGFHIPFVHKGLTENLNYSEYKTEIFPYSNLQIGVGKDNESCFNIPKKSIDYGKKIAAYYFWLFPNLMFNFYPWGLSMNVVTPINSEKTKVKFLSYIWDKSKLSDGAGSNLDRVEKEDEEIVEQVQRGVKSRFYDRGHFSPTMEKGVHHFHLLLSNFIQSYKDIKK